jgi:hypothetical protein
MNGLLLFRKPKKASTPTPSPTKPTTTPITKSPRFKRPSKTKSSASQQDSRSTKLPFSNLDFSDLHQPVVPIIQDDETEDEDLYSFNALTQNEMVSLVLILTLSHTFPSHRINALSES